jgi:hypothetical protein
MNFQVAQEAGNFLAHIAVFTFSWSFFYGIGLRSSFFSTLLVNAYHGSMGIAGYVSICVQGISWPI